MKILYSFALVSVLCLNVTAAKASDFGQRGFAAVKHCVMENDTESCHNAVTPSSQNLVDRFMGYRLMPCLPTNFTYEGDSQQAGYTIVKATMPAPDNRIHVLRLAFDTTGASPRLDVPESLRIGLGEKWQDKLQMAEQLFLFIRSNSGGNFSCNDVESLRTVVRK